jgi:hypothetical protein
MRALHRELWLRSLPHGLVSGRYLLPGQDEQVRRHRRLWLQGQPSWPRMVWVVIEFWLWLRWIGFGAWRQSWRVVRRLGPQIQAREGLSITLQGWRTLTLALAWCIPPHTIYLFGLYRRPENALDYVHDTEVNAYHRQRSESLGLTRESIALLQDKWQQAQVFAADGIPMTSTLACLSRGADAALASWLSENKVLFCKTRSGCRGEGAFSVWITPGGMAGRMLDGKHLQSPAEVESAWHSLLAKDDVLIQLQLSNHPQLAKLTTGEDAISLRFISEWRGDSLGCLSATLEVPIGHDGETGHPQYVILPVASDGGKLSPFPEAELTSDQARSQMKPVWKLASAQPCIPHWDELVECSFRAHRQFPDVWGIAWDWVITPDGPRLLEGNSGWGMAVPQMLLGGVLQREFENIET